MKKENYKKSILLIVMLFILLFILSGCTSSNNTVNNSQMNNVSKNTTINKTSSNNKTNNTTTNSNISTTSSNTTTTSSNSVVSQLNLERLSIYNGTKTAIIGNAYVIKADKQTIFNFSKEDWLEFRKSYIDTHSGSNWLTIYFGDNTGIIFSGMSFIGTLCNIDADDNYCVASPANDLEYIEIYTDTNEVKYDFPEGGNTTNYFVGLEK